MDWLWLVPALGSLLGAAAAPFLGFYAGRRASIDVYTDLGLAFEKERATTAILRDEIMEMLERTTKERQRIVGERSRLEPAPKKSAEPQNNEIVGSDRESIIDQIRQRYEPRAH